MPIYMYHCSTCGRTSERLRQADVRDRPLRCTYCGAMSTRAAQAELPLPGLADTRHETKLILSDGSRIPGTFGRSHKAYTAFSREPFQYGKAPVPGPKPKSL